MRIKYRYLLVELVWAPEGLVAAGEASNKMAFMADLPTQAITAAVRESLDALHGQFAVAATQAALTGSFQCLFNIISLEI
jgi:hypothetical protein